MHGVMPFVTHPLNRNMFYCVRRYTWLRSSPVRWLPGAKLWPSPATLSFYKVVLVSMQNVLSTPGRCAFGRPVAQGRPQRATRLTCRADGKANKSSSLIGCHSQVWVGGWDKQDIIKSVEGTKNAGFDLIEGIARSTRLSALPSRL